ncbi:MAG: UDP-3-O-(3-hydroxymyristoyl)glucosamine N-acyltransferase [Bacteroidales bacterium]
MKFTARQIADLIGGHVDGNPEAEVSAIGKIESATPGSLAFLANPKYTGFIYTTGASIVLVRKDFVPEQPVDATLIRVEDPYVAFATLLEFYQQARMSGHGISPMASIHDTAVIGEDVYIGEFAVIGARAVIGKGSRIYPQVYIGDDTIVGENTLLYAGVKIYHDCRIGSHCILHSGVVVGADGFGFAVQTDHSYKKVPQTGNVILEDYCEIGANTTIDRATLGSTIVRKGVKLDNLVQVAHNVEIGEDTVIAALTGISGSTKLGGRCMIAGQVGFVGHIEVADEVKIGAQSGVTGSIREKGAVVLGSPAVDASLYKRMLVWFRKLPDLAVRLQELEKKL